MRLIKQKLIDINKELKEPPQYLCLGNEKVNVLLLNLQSNKIQ